MGRGHGGTGGSTWRSGGLEKSLQTAEASIRNSSIENAYVFDKHGKEVYRRIEGEMIHYSNNPKINAMMNKLTQNSHSVEVPLKYVKDHIVTHNHPNGDSFSYGDLEMMLKGDAREIRAVGKNRIYSIKRPKGGWHVSVGEVVRAYQAENRKSRSQHETMLKISKQFGLNYTVTQS